MKYPQLVSMPSAVSDWLEEQLEARGIDAVVYTRYILSLLYRDPIDVICPDQDLHFSQPNKEVRRSGGGRKRFRRSTGWWGHEIADAEKLKRSAAVECLMSAADQKCGIESLVDELCEKLKEINSNSTVNNSELPLDRNLNQREISPPQDPAKRYYAAFPPLSRNSTSPNLITLIPKWLGSPKKRTPRKQSRSSSYEEKLHHKVDLETMKSRAAGKQRLNYFSRNKKDLGYCRNVAKSMERSESTNDWELYMFNNNSKSKRPSTSTTQGKDIFDIKDAKNVEFQEERKEDLNMEGNWKALEDNLNMYDDLPVDIRELLDSPSPQDDTVEMMNLANMRDTGNKTFIQCGTNIISSIWSNDAAMDDASSIYDNNYNTALDENSTDSFLDLKFSSISIDNKSKWPAADMLAENEANLYFENFNKSFSGSNNVTSIPWSYTPSEKFQKWSDAENYENEMQTNDMIRSLSMLNHSKESSFTEVIPRPGRAFNIFSKNTNVIKLTLMHETALKLEKEDEDLLHSVHSHFKPINEKVEHKTQGQYANGTTFIIPSSLDKFDYKRSESGYLYLESDQSCKKFLEYKNTPGAEFSLKFNICQNDKACQTERNSISEESVQSCEEDVFYFPGDQELLVDKDCECTCTKDKFMMNVEPFIDGLCCPVHLSQSDTVLSEIFGKCDKCDNCNNNTSWDSAWFRVNDLDGKLNKQSIRDIWSVGEYCSTCKKTSIPQPPLTLIQSKLREDVSQDGEQLLSDLSTIQKSYMEELPVAEVTCNISELIGIKERKRRHSSINFEGAVTMQEDSFSFASRFEEDCLMKISTIPTLRSVTL